MNSNERLSESEKCIMKAIWDLGDMVLIQDLTERLATQYGKEYKRTTIATFLSKLCEKKFVEICRKGRLSYVHALQLEEEYKAALTKKEVDFWYRGRISGLIASLYSRKELSHEDIEEIRSLLDEMDESEETEDL